MNRRPAQVAVVVPAHDEEELLAGCLRGLARPARSVPTPVRTIVVLDACCDGTRTVCRSFGVETVQIDVRNVGAARGAGVDRALAGCLDVSALWLAHTDADSRVGSDWLSGQMQLAGAGADAVVGVVHLDEGSRSQLADHRTDYMRHIRPDGSHDHVHGANLGLRASTYLAAGGFRSMIAHEDRDLVRRLTTVPGATVVRSAAHSVETSSRLAGRCEAGFAASLKAAAEERDLRPTG